MTIIKSLRCTKCGGVIVRDFDNDVVCLNCGKVYHISPN
jgi:predicted RNA-binding Zn-ribbon protein involved in translation (DUF1610 family)